MKLLVRLGDVRSTLFPFNRLTLSKAKILVVCELVFDIRSGRTYDVHIYTESVAPGSEKQHKR